MQSCITHYVTRLNILSRIFCKSGTQLYSRNLQLLVPFFKQPSIVLKNIEKVHLYNLYIKSILIFFSLTVHGRLKCSFTSVGTGLVLWELRYLCVMVIRNTPRKFHINVVVYAYESLSQSIYYLPCISEWRYGYEHLGY